MMGGYLKLRKKALEILNSKLSKDLYYHCVHHTLDVLKVINQYIKREKINVQEAKLLRIGVLMHDIGYTVSINDHELRSIEIAEKLMSQFEFSKDHIEIVKDLILSTRVPQKPKNKLEKMICDADLDYLGRPDFYKIGDLLYKEMKAYSNIENKNDWNKVQIKFLEAHKYHTDFARKNRQPHKEKRINELKRMV
jgi:predicted metal-dependent HD superfamily phosphohydrolase